MAARRSAAGADEEGAEDGRVSSISPVLLEHPALGRRRYDARAPALSLGRMPTKLATSSNKWIASGIFLLVLAIYVLSSPGRIDIIDGQARYDVAYNWLLEGRPVLRDPWIGQRMG